MPTVNGENEIVKEVYIELFRLINMKKIEYVIFMGEFIPKVGKKKWKRRYAYELVVSQG